jgi:hypothetical protein
MTLWIRGYRLPQREPLRFDPAMTRHGVVVELGIRTSGVCVANRPGSPKEASVVPIRLGKHSEAMGFLVIGIHPGHAFDDAYRQFVNQIADLIAVGLASPRAYEQERRRAEALVVPNVTSDWSKFAVVRSDCSSSSTRFWISRALKPDACRLSMSRRIWLALPRKSPAYSVQQWRTPVCGSRSNVKPSLNRFTSTATCGRRWS